MKRNIDNHRERRGPLFLFLLGLVLFLGAAFKVGLVLLSLADSIETDAKVSFVSRDRVSSFRYTYVASGVERVADGSTLFGFGERPREGDNIQIRFNQKLPQFSIPVAAVYYEFLPSLAVVVGLGFWGISRWCRFRREQS